MTLRRGWAKDSAAEERTTIAKRRVFIVGMFGGIILSRRYFLPGGRVIKSV
jgi:hypothetical protein